MDVIVYAQTHWDREWYRTFQEFRLRLVQVTDSIIEQLEQNKLDCFYFDGQTIALEDYLEIRPEQKEKILKLIKDKKLFIGPWYVLADEFLVSGESLARNLLTGIDQSKKYGCDEFVGYLPDAFGHSSDIPRLLSAANIDYAIVWRGAGNNKSEFIWKSPDGSSVLATYLTEGYFQDYLNHPVSVQKKAENIEELLDKINKYSLGNLILLPAGGDHLAPPKDFDNLVSQINSDINNYTLCSGSLFNYKNLIKNQNLDLAEVQGELRDNTRNFILPGTLSTRLYLKKANAISTWKLCKLAEPLYSLLQYCQIVSNLENELIYAWKLLLQNHPHDSICGCSTDEVHDEMIPRFNQVNQISDWLTGFCLNRLSQKVKKGDLIVYNSSDAAYSGVIKIKTSENLPQNVMSQYLGSVNEFPQEILYDTERAPVQEDIKEYKEYLIWAEDIKPFSIHVIKKDYEYKKHPTIVETESRFIKNSRIRLEVNDDGTLKLTDSDIGKTFDNLHIFCDLADNGDTYNYSPVINDQPIKASLLKTEVIENGNLRGILRLIYEIKIPESLDKVKKIRSEKVLTHNINVDITVYADSRRVEFNASWENLSCDHILQIRFRFLDMVSKTFAENNFGIIERFFDPDYDQLKNFPAKKDEELKSNTAPMQRFVFANGLGIITEGLSEYGVEGNDLCITMLRSVGKLSGGVIGTRGTPAGPPLDVPGAQCTGIQNARYAICAVHKPEELFMEADQFFGCILTEMGIAPDNSAETEIIKNLLNFNNPDIYTYAVKLPQNKAQKGIIIRLMNISDKKQCIEINSDMNFKEINEINLLESVISTGLEHIEFKPYELKNILLI
ncbi:MAG: glycoside hydrolase family 38 C-terminal domain-containing protein [Candidatus Gastranaerophilales bacterium]|nr:glycoside hydrolase family 38 C-terminal domain-containing protein [Candidatus Gastranaerophilales bacterium]